MTDGKVPTLYRTKQTYCGRLLWGSFDDTGIQVFTGSIADGTTPKTPVIRVLVTCCKSREWRGVVGGRPVMRISALLWAWAGDAAGVASFGRSTATGVDARFAFRGGVVITATGSSASKRQAEAEAASATASTEVKLKHHKLRTTYGGS